MTEHSNNDYDFSDLTIVIKTFIRYKALHKTIACFRRILGEHIKIIVADDTPIELRMDDSYVEEQAKKNVEHIFMPPDSGLCAGRNLLFKTAQTEYVFYVDDDTHPIIKDQDINKALNFLRANKTDIVGTTTGGFLRKGRSGTLCYETMKGKFKHHDDGFYPVDQVANIFIARRQLLVDNPYNEAIKINGEHFSTFYRWRDVGIRVHSMGVFAFSNNNHTPNKAYAKYRRRRGGVRRGLKDIGMKRFFYCVKDLHPEEPEVLLLSHPDHGHPWLQDLMDYNEKAIVHIHTMDKKLSEKQMTQGRDVLVRDWWINNKNKVKSSHLLVITHDTIYRDRLPYMAWLKGMAGAHVNHINKDKGWIWWRQKKKLPSGVEPVGVTPFTSIAFSRCALDAISDPKWDEYYAKGLASELLTPSIINSCGLNVEEMSLPNVSYLPNAQKPTPGVYASCMPNNTNHFDYTHDYLAMVMDFMKSLGITPFLVFGTALFARRNGVLAMPYDSDMDIGVFHHEWTSDVKAAFKKRFKNAYFGAGDLGGRTKCGRHRKRPVDIFPTGKMGENYYCLIAKGKMGKWPAHMFDELDEINLNGYSFKIPSDIDRYLSLTYGDWETEHRHVPLMKKHRCVIDKSERPDLIEYFNMPDNHNFRI